MMLLKEERTTPKAISFKVEIPSDLLTHSPNAEQI
jgi:hypothetical protein